VNPHTHSTPRMTKKQARDWRAEQFAMLTPGLLFCVLVCILGGALLFFGLKAIFGWEWAIVITLFIIVCMIIHAVSNHKENEKLRKEAERKRKRN